ncbi:MAG TPA: bifunctional UDP-sugar hydrolase/5'-nucleotidase [Candidatus Ozemobacteraceae bacterium]|nr:bifunctional UDP-sugar hydrolase/5'-nucleotidase [Candidatus Ozemobacteraceae bacterium]
MIRNLTFLTIILTLILGGLLLKDHMSIPTRHLVIFYTSNLRGQINPFQGEVSDRVYEKAGGLAFLRGLIDDTMKTYRIDPKRALLVDTGDSLFGSPEAALTMGEVPFELLQKTGYDAIAVGNLEFEFGLDTLRRFISSGKLPMLACNYRDLASPVGNTFPGGIVVDKGGTRVGIIGLGMVDLARNTRQENILQVEITDMHAAVQKTATALKAQGAELIVLLSHQPGLDTRQDLPALFPDVDIIIGDLIGTTVLAQGKKPLIVPTPPARGAGVGVIRIPFIGSAWCLEKAIQTTLPVDASSIEPNAALVGEIGRVEAKVDSLLEEVIARAEGTFKRSFSEESSMGNLIADSIRAGAKTEIAFLNSGAIKSVLSSGPISLRDLYDALPFENTVMRTELAGWQIENLVEEGLSGRGSFMQTSGLTCTCSLHNPPGFRLVQIMVGDEPLDSNRTYSVAATDFMFNTPQNWPELRNGQSVRAFGLLRENMKQYLASMSVVTPSLERRYIDVPEGDETLRIQALSLELASLSTPVGHDGTFDSAYGRLVADVLRVETDSDFALVPATEIHSLNEPLTTLTPARLVGDMPKQVGVSTLVVPGETLQSLIEGMLATGGLPLCFAGFSIELKDGALSKIYPWQGDFDRSRTWKVALPSDLPTNLGPRGGLASLTAAPYSTDLRRTFMNGVRRVGGKIELRRAVF